MVLAVSQLNMSRRKQLNPQQMHDQKATSKVVKVEPPADDKYRKQDEPSADCSYKPGKDAATFACESAGSAGDLVEEKMKLTEENKENIGREKTSKEDKQNNEENAMDESNSSNTEMLLNTENYNTLPSSQGRDAEEVNGRSASASSPVDTMEFTSVQGNDFSAEQTKRDSRDNADDIEARSLCIAQENGFENEDGKKGDDETIDRCGLAEERKSFPDQSFIRQTPEIPVSCSNITRKSSTVSESPIVSFELEQLRGQVGLVQQHVSIHTQMISYLLGQINALRSQCNSVTSDSPPPNGSHFNPYYHLMSSYNAPTFSNSAVTFSNMAGLVNARPAVFDGYTNGINHMHAQTAPASNRTSLEDVLNPPKPSLTESAGNHKQEKRGESNVLGSSSSTSDVFIQSSNTNAESSLRVQREQQQSSLQTHRKSPPQYRIDKRLKNQCLTCGKVLSCGSALKLHYRTHTGERPYGCDICPRAFTTRGNLRTHYSSVHHRELPPATSVPRRNNNLVKPSSKVFCPLCNFACSDNASLAQHMQIHATQGGGSTSMPQVNQQQAVVQLMQTSTFQGSTEHVDGAVPEKRRDLSAGFQKNSCKPEPKDEPNENVQMALDLSTGASDKNSVSCKDSSPLNQNDNLSHGFHNGIDEIKKTMKQEHGRESNGLNGNAADMHMIASRYAKSVVNGVQALENHQPRYYACRLCFRRFHGEEQLNKHLLTHDHYSEAFSAAKDYDDSAPAVDRSSGQERFNVQEAKRLRSWCDLCKKQFSSASSLAIHMRTHTGEKPYSCEICQRSFTTRGNLKVHMNIHEYGSGGSRRGRRLSGSRRSQNDDLALKGLGEDGSETPLSIFQRYAALARMANGNPGNLSPSWMDQMVAAQMFQQQQQYLRNLAGSVDSPASSDVFTPAAGNPEALQPSSPEEESSAEVDQKTASNVKSNESIVCKNDKLALYL